MKVPDGIKIFAPHVCIIGRHYSVGLTEMSPEFIRHGIKRIIHSTRLVEKESVEIRGPERNLAVSHKFYNDQAAIVRMNVHDGWHRDVKYGSFGGMVLWASSEPTEFLLPNGEIIQPEPFDVVLADNDFVEHRIPSIIGPNRWFCRWMTEVPKWL